MQVFDDKLFEEFKSRLNSEESIVDFMAKSGLDVSEHNGQFYKCPFHTDKTPSMSVNDKKGVFKCFSCGRGGKYFDFLYQYNKIILGYKKSQKEFANHLITTNSGIRRKYNIESLDKKIQFSPKTISYMLEVGSMGKKNKRLIVKSAQNDASYNFSKKLEIEQVIRETKDTEDILKIFSDIQKNKIEIE